MDTLEDVARRVRDCTDCPLHLGRTNAVPGEGPPDAELLFIGEGPGFQEDRQGRPFVGPAGGFLEQLLQSIGMTRDQVYIANMVKCRPPDNRDPSLGEIAACSKYLDRQIQLIDPRLIVTLGRFATSGFIPGQSISSVRGRLRTVNGQQIFPIMHPAAGLRSQKMRTFIEEDFQKLAGLLDVLRMEADPPSVAHRIREPQADYEPETQPPRQNQSFWDLPTPDLAEPPLESAESPPPHEPPPSQQPPGQQRLF